MAEEVSPLILLAAVSNLLVQEIGRTEHQHLASERFKTDLRAFTARVEVELDARSSRRYLHLADEDDSSVADD